MPTHNIGNFGDQIQKWADKAGLGVDQCIRAALLDISSRVIKRTPVDTGRAKGNWFPSLQAASTEVSIDGSFVSEQSAINLAGTTIESAPGNVYYLTNNLPYIGRLEYDGWSIQAPQGMVRITLSEFEQALNKAASEL